MMTVEFNYLGNSGITYYQNAWDTSDSWSVNDCTVSRSVGLLHITGTGSHPYIYKNFSIASGRKVKVKIRITAGSSSYLRIYEQSTSPYTNYTLTTGWNIIEHTYSASYTNRPLIIMIYGGDATTRADIDFISVGAWNDVSSLCKDLQITDRFASDSYHYANNVADFSLLYDSSAYASIRAATGNILVRMIEDTDMVFSGYFSSSISYQFNGILDLSSIQINAQDYTDYLDIPVRQTQIAWENYAVCTPSGVSTSIVHSLFTAAGLDQSYINPTVTISGVVGAFTSKVNEESYLDLMDKLLHEYGYVSNWDSEGLFTPIPWITASGTSVDYTVTGAECIDTIEETISDRQETGAQIIWYGLGTKTNVRIYTEDLPFDEDGDFSGYVVLAGEYYPVEANVIDDTTGTYQIVYQEYSDDGIRYNTSKYVKDNYDMAFALKHADFSEILITKSHAISQRTSGSITRDVLTYYNDKARVRYYSTSDVAMLYYMHINATVVYKKTLNKISTSLTGKLREYETRFVYTSAIADHLCLGMEQDIINGRKSYSLQSLTKMEEGSYVQLTFDNGISATAYIMERQYEYETKIYSYKLRGCGVV